uniref:Uncharacterized protein n=1 Tax=Triticum urartu TaxID=4572 RepID=A0A8R7V1S9_TRIUA
MRSLSFVAAQILSSLHHPPHLNNHSFEDRNGAPRPKPVQPWLMATMVCSVANHGNGSRAQEASSMAPITSSNTLMCPSQRWFTSFPSLIYTALLRM